MKVLALIAMSSSLALTFVTASVAQDQASPPPEASTTAQQNPAMKSPSDMTQAPLAKGQNSFTQGQARKRIAKAGFTDVSDLTLDSNGLWQGQAKWKGKTVQVALDYKGNVATQ